MGGAGTLWHELNNGGPAPCSQLKDGSLNTRLKINVGYGQNGIFTHDLQLSSALRRNALS